MNKYSLTIDEHMKGELIHPYVKNIITIEGNSITELLGKLPLEINTLRDKDLDEQLKLHGLQDGTDDIPF